MALDTHTLTNQVDICLRIASLTGCKLHHGVVSWMSLTERCNHMYDTCAYVPASKRKHWRTYTRAPPYPLALFCLKVLPFMRVTPPSRYTAPPPPCITPGDDLLAEFNWNVQFVMFVWDKTLAPNPAMYAAPPNAALQNIHSICSMLFTETAIILLLLCNFILKNIMMRYHASSINSVSKRECSF